MKTVRATLPRSAESARGPVVGPRSGMVSLGVAVVMVACGSQAPSAGSGGAPSGSNTPGNSTSGGSSSGGSSSGDDDGGPIGVMSSSGGGSGSGSGGSAALDSGGDVVEGDAVSLSEGGASSSDASGGLSDGIFPPVSDPGVAGPYTPTTTLTTGPSNNYTIFAPKELGQGGIKSPIIIWGDGGGGGSPAGGYPAVFSNLSSHGFLTIGYNGTPAASDMTTALTWIIAQATDSTSPYYNKIDPTKIAAMGHSSGSTATFAIANDPRLTDDDASGWGNAAPHTDLKNLVHPAAEICGDSGGNGVTTGDEARTYCDYDFANATTPLWYGDVIGAAHITITGE